MAAASLVQFQARPSTTLATRSARPTCRAARAAVVPVRAAIQTGYTATSGLVIEGMRPTSPKAWAIIATTLRQAGVSFVSLNQAQQAAAKGTPIVDVRPADEFAKGRVPGSVNCEFYRPITGWDPTKIARRLGFALFGVPGTEANPTFVEEVAAVAPRRNGELLVVCNIGGSLQAFGDSEFGRQSRSLTAAYELIRGGFTNIKVVDGGYNAWVKEDRDVEVD